MSNVLELKPREKTAAMKEDEFLRLAEIIGFERAREIINELWEECRKAKVVRLDQLR